MKRRASSRSADKFPGAEETVLRGGGAFGQINFAGGEPRAQFVRRQIHQLEFRVRQRRVRHGFVNRHAGDLADGFGAAFEVLDVERGENINARVEQFQHVLIAFGMARFRRVGMGEFVHQNQLRLAGQRGIQIKFAQLDAAIFNQPARECRQTFGQRIGFFAAVGFEVADDDIASGGEFAAGGFEHRVGFAHAGAHAEKNLELAATLAGLVALNRGEQRIGIGTVTLGHGFSLMNPWRNSAFTFSAGRAVSAPSRQAK